MTISTRRAYRAGKRARRRTSSLAGWDAALTAFTARHCTHTLAAGMCPTCRAWCEGYDARRRRS